MGQQCEPSQHFLGLGQSTLPRHGSIEPNLRMWHHRPRIPWNAYSTRRDHILLPGLGYKTWSGEKCGGEVRVYHNATSWTLRRFADVELRDRRGRGRVLLINQNSNKHNQTSNIAIALRAGHRLPSTVTSVIVTGKFVYFGRSSASSRLPFVRHLLFAFSQSCGKIHERKTDPELEDTGRNQTFDRPGLCPEHWRITRNALWL
jgi:hypothetical protein